jgi:hypothetical protein
MPGETFNQEARDAQDKDRHAQAARRRLLASQS